MVALWKAVGFLRVHRTKTLPVAAVVMALLIAGPSAGAGEPGITESSLRFDLPRGTSNSPAMALADLPPDARTIVDEYRKASQAIQVRADAKIDAQREKVLPRLKALQDEYCRAMKLEEAVAIRAVIRDLSGLDRDPATLHAMTPADVGKSMLFEVTGALEGTVWGSEVYTSDSSLAAACVHAGVLKVGQRGVVRVRVIDGQPSYRGTESHGIVSHSYGPWSLSYTIERIKPKAASPKGSKRR